MSRAPPIQNCQVNYRKVTPNAEDPYLHDNSEVGINIVLIARSDERIDDTVNDICTFDTGLLLQPVGGSYGMLIATTDLLLKGYTIPSPILIETGSDEPIKVPLYKFREGEDLELPCTGVKLVMFHPGKPAVIQLDTPKEQSNAQGMQNMQRNIQGSRNIVANPEPSQNSKLKKTTVRHHMN